MFKKSALIVWCICHFSTNPQNTSLIMTADRSSWFAFRFLLMITCGCKGIRTCVLCNRCPVSEKQLPASTFDLCKHCNIAYISGTHQCGYFRHGKEFSFNGVVLIENFVTEGEEQLLIRSVSEVPWALSQSGRLKQDYGPRVNFKRQRITFGNFTGLPDYSRFLVERINQTITTHNRLRKAVFVPVELCNLQYCPDRGACIVPHLDDTWVWGDRLITLNLLSPTVLTFTLPEVKSASSKAELERIKNELYPNKDVPEDFHDVAVRAHLSRRSLVIVDGQARYIWLHAIRASDIQAERTAMTFRELSSLFAPPADGETVTEDQIFGKRLMEIAGTYQGSVCSS